MSFKVGDEVLVHTCPRQGKELDWTGFVTAKKHSHPNFVFVRIKGLSVDLYYNIDHICLNTPLAKELL